ncbi:MAG: clostripain-related cysteine peptidase [Eubacterium sp.]|nr:clostripain-related cysteine peptidase [Eubacterium sp.]
MEKKRPRGREEHVTGNGKGVHRRGEGLHTGPVGSSDGYSGKNERPSSGSGSRPVGNRPTQGSYGSGGGRRPSGLLLIGVFILIIVLIVGLTGGCSSCSSAMQGLGGLGDLSSLTGGYTSDNENYQNSTYSSTWDAGTSDSTAVLNTKVAAEARDKRTQILGNGEDIVTIMVYMCGTDLESRSGMATNDLNEMLKADIGDNINLLVYTGGCTSWRNNTISSSVNQIYQIRNHQLNCLVQDDGSKPMVDPSTLSSYIKWCNKNFPANRYELILWDHGGGSVSGYGYDEKYQQKGSMNLAGINKALSDGGVSFDFIGFDACLMATMETALMLNQYSDYLIASEETEPGVGWYYTDWLTNFNEDTSKPTIEVGKDIVDGFVEECARTCRGQQTTLSVIDLAELSATAPDKMRSFSESISSLISEKNYSTVSDARYNTREFSRSSGIDQVDLIDLANNMKNDEGKDLADVLTSAVKYNRTSSNMTHAYGISIYFPYRRTTYVDTMVDTYDEIGMDDSYSKCIRDFAAVETSGQAVTGGTSNPLSSLLGGFAGSSSSGTSSSGSMDVSQIAGLLSSFLGSDFSSIEGLTSSNTSFLSGKSIDDEEIAQYLADNQLDSSSLRFEENSEGDYVLSLSEEQWNLVHSVDMNMFYDDGNGYVDLGLDNLYTFDDDGNLVANTDHTWLAIDGQPVAYYHLDTEEDGDNYTITGRVPAYLNGERVNLILVFDNDNPYGYIAGAQTVYENGETLTSAKALTELNDGDRIDFVCDYYTYDQQYQDSYYLGDPLTYSADCEISNVNVGDGDTLVTYRFTDIYNQQYWTLPVGE